MAETTSGTWRDTVIIRVLAAAQHLASHTIKRRVVTGGHLRAGQEATVLGSLQTPLTYVNKTITTTKTKKQMKISPNKRNTSES